MKEEVKKYLNRYCINQRINFRSNLKESQLSDLNLFCKRIKLITSIYELSLDRKGHKFYSDALNPRKTLALPKGKFAASDGIYNYEIEVSANESLFASIYNKNESPFSSHLTLFRDTEYIFEDNSREHYFLNKLKRKSLSVLVSVGGLSVHSKDVYSFITRLYLKPRSSFKEYIQKINS